MLILEVVFVFLVELGYFFEMFLGSGFGRWCNL